MKGALLAKGRTAEVYAWGDDGARVIKLFLPDVDAGLADYELRVARAAYTSGAGAPAVYELVEVEGRRGLVYARVDGQTLFAYWLQRPFRRMASSARWLAAIHHTMHSAATDTAGDLPQQAERLHGKIARAARITAATKARAQAQAQRLAQASSVPTAVCHGDFHPMNILIDAHKNVVVIDWMDATLGSPLEDVGRTVLLMRMAARTAVKGLPQQIIVRNFTEIYLNAYCGMANVRRADVLAWLPVLAAARLEEGIREEEDALVQMVEAAFGAQAG